MRQTIDCANPPAAAAAPSHRPTAAPRRYWKSEGERAGKSPMQDPLAIIGVVAIFFPFVLLGICAAFGLIDFSGGRG